MDNFIFVDTIDSTNEECKRLFEKSAPEYTVVSAGQQTGGKGRTGRHWESPKGESVSTSILLYPTMPTEKISAVTILAAVAVAEAIEKEYALDTKIKWPNDVLINKRKICGILTEMSVKDSRAEYAIVGIGINIHQKSFEGELKEKATSVDIELKEQSKKELSIIIETLWTRFKEFYEKYCITGDLLFIKEAYERRLVTLGREVRIEDPAGPYEAKALGIASDGSLMVSLKNGETRIVNAGEVSVRGIYGYI